MFEDLYFPEIATALKERGQVLLPGGSRLPSASQIRGAAEIFRMLTDPLRIRILLVLAQSESCVGDLCLALDMSQPMVSQQLKKLKEAGLIESRRVKQRVYYSLCREKCPGLLPLLEQMTAIDRKEAP
jgi:ArsR family transcriptional regulator, virulence genes transcriptional regulator